MSPKKPISEREIPSGKHGLRGQSVSRLRRAFQSESLRVSATVQFHGNELRPGPLLSMVVAWFLDQSEDVRDAVVARGQQLYEDMTDPPNRTKRRNPGNPTNPKGSGPKFGVGETIDRKLGVPIPGPVNRLPKRRANQHRAAAEVQD